MTFAAAGLARAEVEEELMVAVLTFSQEATQTMVTAYAIRIAGIFMMTFASMVLRTAPCRAGSRP
jgi:hypothetical protein